MKYLTIIAAVLALTGCASTPEQQRAFADSLNDLSRALEQQNQERNRQNAEAMRNMPRTTNCISQRAGNTIQTRCN